MYADYIGEGVVGFYGIMNEEAKWDEVQYYATTRDLEPYPSDCIWMVPGTYKED